ncbi:MAG: BTAD domain-containing putative transcriptional regulator [Herpetosiphon sp.]
MTDVFVQDAGPQLTHSGFRIALLGVPELTWAGRSLPITRRQTRALLYRLAAHGLPVARDQLCYLFWPDVGDALARRNLTHLLTHLRRVLPQPELLQTDDERVALDLRTVQSDAVVFDRLTATADAAGRPAALRAAVDLYRGPFLAGFGLPNCPEYDTWVDGERSMRERRYLDVLAAVIELSTAHGDYTSALTAAKRYLAVDELAEDMHRRLMSLYAALGDRAAATRQFEHCTVVLEREIGVSPLAETRAIYEAVRDGRPVLGPLSQVAASMPKTPDGQQGGTNTHAAGSLPAAMGSLIGRSVELDELQTLLRDPEVRLLTLSGTGGVGKTRLALEAARAVTIQYADGATLVELAPLRDPALVVPAIAAALGLGDQSERPPLVRVQEFIRDRELLLVLDNFEHVVSAAPAVAALLAGAPRLKVVVTSRAVLRITGEHVYPVPSLAVPDAAQFPPLDDLGQVGAVALFVTRVRARLADFRLTARNAPDIAAICLRLDGLPLALELAAARAALLSPRALLARLDHRLALLTDGPRDVPERQRTLRATIDWSYELLDRGEQLLLARLAVFAGGWTLEAAEAVSAAVGATTTDVLAGLHALLDKQLVNRNTGEGGELRFTMLETIREYALERLTERGELAVTQQAHARWFLGLAEQAARAFHGPEQGTWFDRLEDEHANLRVVLAYLLAEEDVASMQRLAGALHWFWYVRGHLTEGRAWLERSFALRESAAPLRKPLSFIREAQAHFAAGHLASFQGDLPTGRRHLEQSVALCRDLDEPAARMILHEALTFLVVTCNWQGDGAAVALLIPEYFALVHALDMPWSNARQAFNLARLELYQHGHIAPAEAHLLEAQAIFQALGDSWYLAQVLSDLGLVALERGDVDTARKQYMKTFAAARALKERALEADARNSLGEIARLTGDDQSAADHYTASLQMYRELDNAGEIPRLRHNLGYLALHAGDRARSQAHFVASLRGYQASGLRRGVASALAGLAAVAANDLTIDAALQSARLWGAAASILTQEGTPVWSVDQMEIARYQALAQATAGPDAFDSAMTAGASLLPADAVAEALRV